jgi:hypothetical protein
MRELAREAHDMHLGFSHDMIEWSTDLVDEMLEPGCDAAGHSVIAPMGAGFMFPQSMFCKDTLDIPFEMIKLGNDLVHNAMAFDVGVKGLKDCDVLDGGIERTFCDIHCIRDAVVRGDRNINVNIQNASRIIKANMKTTAEWLGDITQTESKWLGEKVDGLQATVLKDIEGFTPASLAVMTRETASMAEDLEGMAADASLSSASRAATSRSVSSFLTEMSKWNPADSRENATWAAHELHGQVSQLHAALMSATSGISGSTSTVGTMLQSQLAQLRRALKADINMLGVYKQHRKRTKAAFKASRSVRGTLNEVGATNVLLILDQHWWALRELYDGHLESVEAQTEAHGAAIQALQDYHQCKTAFEDLSSVYLRMKRAKASAVKLLQETWRKSSNLLGEIAATLTDGDAFAKLVLIDLADAGYPVCGDIKEPELEKVAEVLKQGITGQTFEQVGAAFNSLHVLLYHYEKTTLPRPDLDIIRTSAAAIVESYNATMRDCGVPIQ